MAVSIAVGFGYVFYLPSGALFWFIACLFVLGIGGANFAMYTLWLPEQYQTSCRASAFAFATSVGRFAGAGVTFLVGAGVAHFQSIGTPVALTSIAFLVGLVLLPFGEETRTGVAGLTHVVRQYDRYDRYDGSEERTGAGQLPWKRS